MGVLASVTEPYTSQWQNMQLHISVQNPLETLNIPKTTLRKPYLGEFGVDHRVDHFPQPLCPQYMNPQIVAAHILGNAYMHEELRFRFNIKGFRVLEFRVRLWPHKFSEMPTCMRTLSQKYGVLMLQPLGFRVRLRLPVFSKMPT